MAASHAGALEMSCTKCHRDPSLKELWGCDKPSQEVVKAMPDDDWKPIEYYSCPLNYITQSCNDWYNKYICLKDGFALAEPYSETEVKFFAMKNYYELWFGVFKDKVSKNV